MSFLDANGIRLSYRQAGRGADVLLIQGSSAAGYVWDLHQTPALHRAGYRTVTFENRGVPPSDVPPGRYSLAQLVADTKGLIEGLALAPCRIVGTSLGSLIAQELAISEPRLVRSAVLLATRARSDVMRRAQDEAEKLLLESGVRLPARYRAVNSIQRLLSPITLNDDEAVANWLEVFELAGGGDSAAGQSWIDTHTDRRRELRQVHVPCRVIAFSDDVVTPPHMGFEVADAVPHGDYVEIPAAGHLGHLEQPDAVNAAIVEFFEKY